MPCQAGVFSPCIMCVQYRGGYHYACGGNLEYCGGCLVPWRDTMINVGIS